MQDMHDPDCRVETIECYAEDCDAVYRDYTCACMPQPLPADGCALCGRPVCDRHSFGLDGCAVCKKGRRRNAA